MEIKIEIPREVAFVLERLEERGFRADIVGGAVRDACLGKTPGDFDVTTNARPESIKEAFCDTKTIDTGIKHGTVTVHKNGVNVEVTTYRIDGKYNDARHPESVEFTEELALDLSRRDFTVNAMCYSRARGLTDMFGGIADLNSKTVRTVGQAHLRFTEDALRILRALRFASVLDFEIDDSTRAAIFDLYRLLDQVSRERIYTELKKLISGTGAYRILKEYRAVIEYLLPINVEYLPSEEAFLSAPGNMRMLLLFAGLGKGSDAVFDKAMADLRTDNKTRIDGSSALRALNSCLPTDERAVLYAFNTFGRGAVTDAVELGVIIGKFDEKSRKTVERALNSGVPYTTAELKIGGRELVAAGLRGEAVGKALNRLLHLVIDGECANERDALLQKLNEI